MAGIWTNEGEEYALNVLLGKVAADTTLWMGLFENSSGLSEASVMTNITEPSGDGYTRQGLAPADWTITPPDLATGTQETFTSTTGSWNDIYGWFLTTDETGTAGDLLCYEFFSSEYTVGASESIKVTPKITAD